VFAPGRARAPNAARDQTRFARCRQRARRPAPARRRDAPSHPHAATAAKTAAGVASAGGLDAAAARQREAQPICAQLPTAQRGRRSARGGPPRNAAGAGRQAARARMGRTPSAQIQYLWPRARAIEWRLDPGSGVAGQSARGSIWGSDPARPIGALGPRAPRLDRRNGGTGPCRFARQPHMRERAWKRLHKALDEQARRCHVNVINIDMAAA
jgi:hypothetical protein